MRFSKKIGKHEQKKPSLVRQSQSESTRASNVYDLVVVQKNFVLLHGLKHLQLT